MIKINPFSGDLGADITGADLGNITDEDFEEIYKAWLDFGVLRFHGQQLDDDALMRFSERFGPLEEIPGYDKFPDKVKKRFENRYVTVISNIVENGKPLGGLGSGEAKWHSDMTYVERPPPASVLLGVEIPSRGGDTWFANQYTAYKALPVELKNRVENLQINHDSSHTSVGDLRIGFDAVKSPEEAPGTAHPIVSTHPETGEKCLYLGRREWAYVLGLNLDDSEKLLDELWQYAALDENVIKHKWTEGDVIIWDNRCVLHRRDEIDPNDRRLLRRCQVLPQPDKD